MIADRLEATLKYDAINGNHHEKAIVAKQIKEAILVIRGLYKALDDLLDHDLANRGSKDEFFMCHTYAPGMMPDVVKKAKLMLEERS